MLRGRDWRRGAQGAAQATADGLDGLVGDRVGVAVGLVFGGDGGAGAFDGTGGDALGGEVGEVGADGGRGRGQGCDAAIGAPAFEAPPLPRVGPAGGGRAAGGDGLADPGEVLVGQSLGR